VPFVVLVIGALGLGLGITLWLSTGAAERSYQLGAARETNQALLQQKESLERDVLEAQAAPALAEEARKLGMIPSKDTAHLVQDPAGNWVVVGTPKPAEGVPPPPLNTPLADTTPVPPPPPPPAAPRVVDPRELAVHVPTGPQVPGIAAPLVAPAPVPVPAPLGAEPVPVAPPVAPAPLAAPAAPAPLVAPVAPAPLAAPAPVAPPVADAPPGPDHLAAPEPALPGPASVGEQFSPVTDRPAGPAA
jgi:hypothetical protein